MIPTAQETYALMLLHHGHGYPLWIPEPNNSLPPSTYAEGLRLGDVGLLTPNGGFDYLFNIFVDENDEINRWRGVPEGFIPIEFKRSLVCSTENQHRPKVPICSQHTKQLMLDAEGMVVIPGMPVGIGSGIELKFSRSRGAALMLPEGASRVDYLALPDIRDYAAANAESWYQFVHDTLRLDADNGSLYVITGYDKTHSYETASFYHSSKNSTVSLRFTSPLLVDGNYGKLSLSYSSDFYMPISSRASKEENALMNLSVFVRGFKVMMRKGFGRGVGKGFRKTNGVKLMDVTKTKPDDVVGTRPWSQRSSGSSSSSGASSGSSSRPPTGSSMNSTSSSTKSLGMDQDVEDVFAFSVFDTDPIESDDTAGIVSALDRNITDRTSTMSYHPSDEVNKRLLEMFPHCNVAITHDNQWASVLDGADHDFPPDEILFEKITKHHVAMVNNGVIHLSEKDCENSQPSHDEAESLSEARNSSDSSDSDSVSSLTESDECRSIDETSGFHDREGGFQSEELGKHKVVRCFRKRIRWMSWKLN